MEVHLSQEDTINGRKDEQNKFEKTQSKGIADKVDVACTQCDYTNRVKGKFIFFNVVPPRGEINIIFCARVYMGVTNCYI